MKSFFIALFISVTSLFNKPESTPVLRPPEIVITPTSNVVASVSATIVSTPSGRVVTLKPSPTISLKTSITEEVLRKSFGQTEKASIERILTIEANYRDYEKYYYDKFKKFPVPRVDTTKSTVMPSKNGPVLCTTQQLKDLYSELDKAEKSWTETKTNFDCYYNPSKKETDECREYRRTNADKTSIPSSNRDLGYMERTKSVALATFTKYDEVLEKICKKS